MLGRVRITLTLTHVAVVAVVVVALMVSAFFIAQRMIYRNADRELARTAQIARDNSLRSVSISPTNGNNATLRIRPEPSLIFAGTPVDIRRSDLRFFFFDTSGDIILAPGQTAETAPAQGDVAVALTGESKLSSVSVDSISYRVATEPLLINRGRVVGAVQIAQSREVQDQILATLRNVLIAIGGAGLLFAAGTGYLLAGRAMRPVNVAMERQRSFVADAAHELRTPLAIISANAEALEMGDVQLDDQDKELLSGIRAESSYLAALVTKLLDMAKLEASSGTTHQQDVDLAHTLNETCQAMLGVAESKNVRLTWSGTDDPIFVKGDPVLIRLVALSLLDNAIKYNSSDGSVELRLADTGDEANVEISDTGPGIPADDLTRVFDRFYRVDRARSREAGGVGLGLALAQRATTALRGSLDLRSEPGIGTTATIRLNRSQA